MYFQFQYHISVIHEYSRVNFLNTILNHQRHQRALGHLMSPESRIKLFESVAEFFVFWIVCNLTNSFK